MITATAMLGIVASCSTVGDSVTSNTTAPAGDIVATAIGAGSFTTLVSAVEAAGLVETLQGEGPFTVFAPTDDAFAALPDGAVASLLKPENKDQLVTILTYHVVPGQVAAGDLLGSSSDVATVEGRTLAVDGTGAGVTVNGANVLTPDVFATNGVIHVIDTVLLPN